MFLKDLANEDVWTGKKRYMNRFIRHEKKKASNFDPENLRNTSVEILADIQEGFASEERLLAELNDWKSPGNFDNPSPKTIKDFIKKPYELLVLKYGILKCLVESPDYQLPMTDENGADSIYERVKKWEQKVLDTAADATETNERVKRIAIAAAKYDKHISSSELNLIKTFIDIINEENEKKSHDFHWPDFFKIMAAENRFPKSSGTQIHSVQSITDALLILQEHGIIYEIKQDGQEIIGIPEDYGKTIRNWLGIELTGEEYEEMMDTLKDYYFTFSFLGDIQSKILGKKKGGSTDAKKRIIIDEGILPSEALGLLKKNDLKTITEMLNIQDQVDRRQSDSMIEGIINKFHQSSTVNDDKEQWLIDHYLALSQLDAQSLPARITTELTTIDTGKSIENKIAILFEEATAKIFRDLLHFDDVQHKGQGEGYLCDGIVKFDGKTLVWENKSAKTEYKANSDHGLRFKEYIQSEKCSYFLLIAPQIADSVKRQLQELDVNNPEVDILYMAANHFLELAKWWNSKTDKTFDIYPLVKYGTEPDELESAKKFLEKSL